MTLPFDPACLPAPQRARFDAAIDAYMRVIEHNRAAIAPDPDDLFAGLEPHAPGPRSALFARLLAGRDAFERPPPTAFGYPWYALLDERRARPVTPQWPPVDGPRGRLLRLNGATWRLADANFAGERLLDLLDDAGDDPHGDAPAARLRRAEPVLRQAPAFVVEHPGAPRHRLVLGRGRRVGRRDLVLAEGIDAGSLDGGRAVLLPNGDPASRYVVYECDVWHLERVDAG